MLQNLHKQVKIFTQNAKIQSVYSIFLIKTLFKRKIYPSKISQVLIDKIISQNTPKRKHFL